jgi:hypothetical protein
MSETGPHCCRKIAITLKIPGTGILSGYLLKLSMRLTLLAHSRNWFTANNASSSRVETPILSKMLLRESSFTQ